MTTRVLIGVVGPAFLLLLALLCRDFFEHIPEQQGGVLLQEQDDIPSAGAGSSVEGVREPEREPIAPTGTGMNKEPDPCPEPTAADEQDCPWEFVVLTKEGLPIRDARLVIFEPSHGDPKEETLSGRYGKVEFRNPNPGDGIEAEAAGCVPLRLSLGNRPWASPYPIVMRKGRLIVRGEIVNESGGPVEGALVEMSSMDMNTRSASAKDGTFRLFCLDPPKKTFEALFKITHPSYCFLGDNVPMVVKMRADRVRFTLLRWARLKVNVLGPSGAPLAGARVCLAGPPNASDRGLLPGSGGEHITIAGSRASGANESAESNGIPVENETVVGKVPPRLPLWLKVNHPRYGRIEREIGMFEPGEERSVTVELVCPSELQEARFQIVDPNGNPIPESRVWLSWSEEGSGCESGRQVEMDPCASFCIFPPAEKWELAVSAPGFVPLKKTVCSAIGPGVTRLMLDASDAGLTVKVIDVHGAPVPDVLLMIEDVETKSFNRSLRTDEAGFAVFSGLDPTGAYSVNLWLGRPGAFYRKIGMKDVPCPAAYRNARPGLGQLVFRLVPPASIGGRICLGGLEGKPAFLSLVEEMQPDKKPFFTIDTIIGSNGSFFFAGLPPGRYNLWIPGIKGGDGFSTPLAHWSLDEGERRRDVDVGAQH